MVNAWETTMMKKSDSMNLANRDHRSLTPTSYLPTLDGWRAIAILGVLIGHATSSVFCPGGSLPNAWWYALTRNGGLGVDIFFGISGFLICSRLLGERRQSGRISLGKFYIRRSFRILPASFTYLAVVGLLTLAGYSLVSPIMWWSCVAFFRNYLPLPGPGGHYTAHFWSLGVEEHFYLLWPGLLFVFGPRRARRLAVVLALAVAAWRIWDFRHQWLERWIPNVGFFPRTDIRLDGLLWGCWAALVRDIPVWRERLTRWLSPRNWFGLVAAFIACVLYKPPLTMMWQSFLIPFILLGTVLHPKGVAGWFLETQPVRWIGRVSYSLYLWNLLFFPGGSYPRPLPLGIFQQLPLSILMVFLCASLSYYLVERPMVRLGHSLTVSNSRLRQECQVEERQKPQAA
jgi:peptidoglycan/LPS O-acetylase OafA/YrhL